MTSSKPPLTLQVVSSHPSTQAQLAEQLGALPFVGSVVCIEPQEYSAQQGVDYSRVLLVDFTDCEDKASQVVERCLVSQPHTFIIALHEKMDAEIILAAIRAGAREFIQYPKDDASLLQILMRQHQHQTLPSTPSPVLLDKPSKGTLLGIFSPKGGGGTTTIALNLGQQIQALSEQRVVVVDLNPQYNTYEFLVGAQPKYALSDLAAAQQGSAVLDMGMMAKIITPSKAGISLLVGSKDITDDTPPLTEPLVESVLEALMQQFDWVLVDMPSQTVDGCHQQVFEQCDEMMVISMMDMPSLQRTRQYFDLAKLYLQPQKMSLLLNRYNLSAAFSVSNEKLEEAFQYDVKARLSNDWNTCVEAATLGEFLTDIKEKSPLLKDIQVLAKQLIQGHRGGVSIEQEPGDGLFSKMKMRLFTHEAK